MTKTKNKVAPDLSISSLKSLLTDKLQIPSEQQRLMFKGKSMSGILKKAILKFITLVSSLWTIFFIKDTSFLNDYAISADTKIHLIILKKANTGDVATPKEEESTLTKELKAFAEKYSLDVDQFVVTFKKVSAYSEDVFKQLYEWSKACTVTFWLNTRLKKRNFQFLPRSDRIYLA